MARSVAWRNLSLSSHASMSAGRADNRCCLFPAGALTNQRGLARYGNEDAYTS